MILFVFSFCLPLTFRVLIWSRSYVIFIHSFIHSHFLHLLFASVSCMSWSFSTLNLVLFCSMVIVMVMVMVVVVFLKHFCSSSSNIKSSLLFLLLFYQSMILLIACLLACLAIAIITSLTLRSFAWVLYSYIFKYLISISM